MLICRVFMMMPISFRANAKPAAAVAAPLAALPGFAGWRNAPGAGRPGAAGAAQRRHAHAAGRRSEPGAARPVAGPVDFSAVSTGTPLLRADLRDLQDLPDHAGQVHPDPRGVHRRHHRPLLRRAAALRPAVKVAIILLFSLIGIAGSYGVAWFGIRVNTFANSRTAFASLAGKPYPIYAIPLKAGMSIGMLLISVELFIMLCILLFIPGDYAGPCFIGFAIGESLGAAALRIAGGIFTKIADIGSDLMKIVFNIKEDDARNPGVIADCTGDNAGDSVGPSADGFETYGVTGVALISFILLAVPTPAVQVQLLVWIFVMRVMMVIASGALLPGQRGDRPRRATATPTTMNFEAPLTVLVWLTSIVSVVLTYVASSYLLIPTSAATARCGGSCPPSSPAARWPARSSPSWSRSSPRPSRRTCRRSSPRRARAARR